MILTFRKNEGERLDSFLSDTLPQLSRSRIKKLIESKKVKLNGAFPKPSATLHFDDKIEFPDALPSEETDILPANVEIKKIFEDEDILIINKLPGQVVHPGIGHNDDTIVNGLMKLYGDRLPIVGGRHRPGIVHRLDKDTSGLLMVALNDQAFSGLTQMQRERKIKKIYVGICMGRVKDKKGEIRYPIGRSVKDGKLFTKGGLKPKSAITLFRRISFNKGYSLMSFGLITGRTHQIRVHMKSIGHPIAGDLQYSSGKRELTDYKGGKISVDHHMLTAHRLIFRHPVNGKKMDISLPYEKCPDFSRFFPDINTIPDPY